MLLSAAEESKNRNSSAIAHPIPKLKANLKEGFVYLSTSSDFPTEESMKLAYVPRKLENCLSQNFNLGESK